MQRGSAAAGAEDAGVRLLEGPAGNTLLEEQPVELGLGGRRLDTGHARVVGGGGGLIGLLDQRDFVGRLDDAGLVDGREERGGVGGGESCSGGELREGVERGGGKGGEVGSELGDGAHGIDIELGKGLGGDEGKAAPDDLRGVEIRDVEGEVLVREVVG